MKEVEFSSFRDPDGKIFYQNGEVYREVNFSYKEDYDHLINSGLYQELINKSLIVKHIECNTLKNEHIYKTIKVEKIPYISYPYEWCFEQLKSAALLTLDIIKIALNYNMTLKDASAFNVMFIGPNPLFIDSLSFIKYKEGESLNCYGQFCRHFLAPLCLMKYKDLRLLKLFQTNLDGFPLDLTSKLLPLRAKMKLGIFSHIVIHSLFQNKFAKKTSKTEVSINKKSIKILLSDLYELIKSINLKQTRNITEWGDYYNDTNYSDNAFVNKKDIIKEILSLTEAKLIFDMGSNNGEFSRIDSKENRYHICFDIDTLAVNQNYLITKHKKENNILPLWFDIMNPSCDSGFACNERKSIMQRPKADLVQALALIHHLSISNNLPFEYIRDFFFNLTSKYLVIEFVPKEDSKVQILLASRKDIFPHYNIDYFEKVFCEKFIIIKKYQIHESNRIIYLMEKKYE